MCIVIEPTLLPLTGERMEHRTAIDTNEARLDIKGRRFWIWGQQAFLDIMVFDPNACRYSNSSLSQCYTTNTLCKSNKELLAPWYFQFTVVWVENVKTE